VKENAMTLLQHSLGVMTHPSSEWVHVREENISFKQLYMRHVPFLALIPAVASFFGVTRVGWQWGDGEVVKLTVNSALSLSGITYVALMLGVFCFGEFINWMARTYGVSDPEGQRHRAGTALAICATTPLFLAGIFLIFPNLWLNVGVMMMASAYSLYLIFNGLPVLMNISSEQAQMYAYSITTVGMVLMVTTLIGTVLVWGMGMGPVYVSH